MRVLLAILLLCSLGGLPARAQMDSREGIALQNQILELRRDLQYLQHQQASGPPPPPSYRGGGPVGGSDITAELLGRVQQLEEEVRRIRGRLDELDNQNQRAQADLAKQIADLSFRLQNGGPAAAASGTPSAPALQSAPPASGPVPPQAPSRRTPELAMQQGNAALARRDYPAAEAAAREVLAAGRNTPRAADANFLLAQSLMGQRNYQGAAVAYDDAYNRSRSGSRAPDALLGLANAMTGLSDRASACGALDKLRAEFPSERPNVREAAAALRARNGCR